VPEFEQHRKDDAIERLKALIPADSREWCTPEELVITGKPHREIVRVAGEISGNHRHRRARTRSGGPDGVWLDDERAASCLELPGTHAAHVSGLTGHHMES